MSVTYPEYYEKFTCTASSCEDSCCIGWEINIDRETEEAYRQVSGPFGAELCRSIVTEEGQSHFRLAKQRCPFLNEQNLCKIILTLGENSLCEICREHPRFHNQYGTIKESGLGLCCEEAARLLFSSSRPLKFVTKLDDAVSFSGNLDSDWIDTLYAARKIAFSLMQNRNYSIRDRLALLLAYGEDLQDLIDLGVSLTVLEQTVQEYSDSTYLESLLLQLKEPPEEKTDLSHWWEHAFRLFRSLESIDATWRCSLDTLSTNVDEARTAGRDFETFYSSRSYEYEHFCVYLLFRYWMEGLYDGDLLSRVKFVVISFLFLNLWDCQHWLCHQTFTLKDRIFIAKNYSKEVEYNLQNMEILLNTLREDKDFSVSDLFSALLDEKCGKS